MTQRISRLLVAIALVGTVTSAQRGVPIPQHLVFTPYHASGIYDVGDTIGWTVAPAPAAPTYAYKWTIRRNNAVVLKEGTLDLSSGKDTIEIVADQPETIYVAVEAYAERSPAPAAAATEAPRFSGGNAGRNTGFYAVGAAVSPTKIGLSAPRPADFDAFWESKLAAQSKIPINAVLMPVESGVPDVEMNLFELDALGSKAHGYVARPAKAGKFPALIQLQYAGVYALNLAAVARRAAAGWLMINVAGLGFIDTISPPAGVWTMLNQIPGPVEALPMIESEHDNLTPDKGRACPARTNEILDALVHGEPFAPKVLR